MQYAVRIQGGIVKGIAQVGDGPIDGVGWQAISESVYRAIKLGGLGGTLDGDVYTAPVRTIPKFVNGRSFLRLFTPAQYIAIRDHPDVRVQYFIELARVGEGIDLNHPDTINGLLLLQSLLLLTAEDVARIRRGEQPV